MRVVTPEDRKRWSRKSRLKRFGLTPEQFQAMLEAQGYACALCHGPFEDGERIAIDHDHDCCPVPPNGNTRSCGRCVRAPLHLKCTATST